MELPPIDEKTRLNLQRMMKENDVAETTDQIRELKHSKLIRQDVKHMKELKNKYKRISHDQFKQIATTQCNFLFNNYTNIFNRLLADELDYSIMHQFLGVLEEIENGTVDQHQGSYQIGMILKKMYVDSALKREEHINDDGKKVAFKKPLHKVSWEQFKLLNESGEN
jgi:hypothetical protein